MPPQIKAINEILICPNLNESVGISAIQKTEYGKTWIARFECDHRTSCSTVCLSSNSFNFDSCPLLHIFKSKGNR